LKIGKGLRVKKKSGGVNHPHKITIQGGYLKRTGVGFSNNAKWSLLKLGKKEGPRLEKTTGNTVGERLGPVIRGVLDQEVKTLLLGTRRGTVKSIPTFSRKSAADNV